MAKNKGEIEWVLNTGAIIVALFIIIFQFLDSRDKKSEKNYRYQKIKNDFEELSIPKNPTPPPNNYDMNSYMIEIQQELDSMMNEINQKNKEYMEKEKNTKNNDSLIILLDTTNRNQCASEPSLE